jgi:hypothetical protein
MRGWISEGVSEHPEASCLLARNWRAAVRP